MDFDKFFRNLTIGLLACIICFGLLGMYAAKLMETPQAPILTKSKVKVEKRVLNCLQCHRGMY